MRAAAPAALAGEERGPQQPVEGGGDGRVVQQPSPPGVDNASKTDRRAVLEARFWLTGTWGILNPGGFAVLGAGELSIAGQGATRFLDYKFWNKTFTGRSVSWVPGQQQQQQEQQAVGLEATIGHRRPNSTTRTQR